jgi:hypothetical protein
MSKYWGSNYWSEELFNGNECKLRGVCKELHDF